VSIGKSVPNLIYYLHVFLQNFSQSLAICFELFSFREFVYSEIADSGPHLSARRRRGLKPLSGRATRIPTAASTASRPPDNRPCAPTASHAPPLPRPSPRPRRPRPVRLTDRAAVLTGASPVDAVPPSAAPRPLPAHRRRLAEQRRHALRRARARAVRCAGRPVSMLFGQPAEERKQN
jgi:hypothetical protein